jgi:PIN domain nuclease of toxin-antitoxin system
MKFLLDTHVFLWSLTGENLSYAARDAFLDTNNQLFLSAASYWEICIKQSIGKLQLAPDWADIFDRELAANSIQWLPIEKAHCRQIGQLPPLHGDPFDRLLIAQAQCESMTLLTANSNIQAYPVETFW